MALFTFSMWCQAAIDVIGRIAYRSTGGTRGPSTHGCDPGASVPMLLELLFGRKEKALWLSQALVESQDDISDVSVH